MASMEDTLSNHTININMPEFYETLSSYIHLDCVRTKGEIERPGADVLNILNNSYARIMTITTIFLIDGAEEAKNSFIPTLFNPNNVPEVKNDLGETEGEA